MKMILVHNWIIRQTSLHALLVSCFPLHNITYDYIFQAGLMNNVLLRYKVKDVTKSKTGIYIPLSLMNLGDR